MEINEWLPSAAAVLIGLASAWIGSQATKYQTKHQDKRDRVLAFRNYERVINDIATDWELHMLGMPGSHFSIGKDELKSARDQFFPYLYEFEDHKYYYRLFSPHDDWKEGEDPSLAVDFYSSIVHTLRDHIRDYPRPLPESPYKKSN